MNKIVVAEGSQSVSVSPQKNTARSVISATRGEIDSFYKEMATFEDLDAAEIFKRISAMSSRMSYLRGCVMRSSDSKLQSLRIKEIDPFLSECDRQFKTWSRLVSVINLEWDISSKS